MSAGKHTPGPWKALIQKKSKYFPQGSAMVATGEGRMAIDCSESGDTQEASAANALLIAAAPDLLSELREVLDWAVKEKKPLRDQEIASIRAALSKATGLPQP